jgi:hypothetical protein
VAGGERGEAVTWGLAALWVLVMGDGAGQLWARPVKKEIGFRFLVLIFSNSTEKK